MNEDNSGGSCAICHLGLAIMNKSSVNPVDLCRFTVDAAHGHPVWDGLEKAITSDLRQQEVAINQCKTIATRV